MNQSLNNIMTTSDSKRQGGGTEKGREEGMDDSQVHLASLTGKEEEEEEEEEEEW